MPKTNLQPHPSLSAFCSFTSAVLTCTHPWSWGLGWAPSLPLFCCSPISFPGCSLRGILAGSAPALLGPPLEDLCKPFRCGLFSSVLAGSCLMPPFGLIHVSFSCSYKQFGAFSAQERGGFGKPGFVAGTLVFYWLPPAPLGCPSGVLPWCPELLQTDVLIPELLRYLL